MLDKIQVNGKEKCFMTLKDHKPNFENNVTARLVRLIDAAKNEITRIIKVILENIDKEFRNQLKI